MELIIVYCQVPNAHNSLPMSCWVHKAKFKFRDIVVSLFFFLWHSKGFIKNNNEATNISPPLKHQTQIGDIQHKEQEKIYYLTLFFEQFI